MSIHETNNMKKKIFISNNVTFISNYSQKITQIVNIHILCNNMDKYKTIKISKQNG